jgi:hypothetical protein
MQFDKFFYFSAFSSQQQQQLDPYFSPDHESSLFKGVPVDRMEEFKRIAKMVVPMAKLRVRFRGPREGAMRDYTLKRKARSVAIYVN